MNQAHVLYLEFGPQHRWQIEKHLIPLLNRLFPGAKFQITIIDNSGEAAPCDLPNTAVIAGDNSTREFSGWQKGIDFLSDKAIDDNTIFCLCNDTFARHYGTKFLDWFDQKEVQEALNRGLAVGHVDHTREEFELFGWKTRKWIRTNIFFLRYAELKKILPIVFPIDEKEIFADEGDSLFKENRLLSPNLRAYLDHWLVMGPEVPGESKERWYMSARLSNENREIYVMKAKSLLIEFSISARLLKEGIEIFDIRRSRSRAGGLYYFASKLGILDHLQNLRRSFLSG